MNLLLIVHHFKSKLTLEGAAVVSVHTPYFCTFKRNKSYLRFVLRHCCIVVALCTVRARVCCAGAECEVPFLCEQSCCHLARREPVG